MGPLRPFMLQAPNTGVRRTSTRASTDTAGKPRVPASLPAGRRCQGGRYQDPFRAMIGFPAAPLSLRADRLAIHAARAG
jgi:hypothetical protein